MQHAGGEFGKVKTTGQSFTGLRAKLVIALLLATVPILSLVGYLGLETTTHLLRTQAEQSLRETVVARARVMQEYLSRAVADARYLARSNEAADFAREVTAGRVPGGPVSDRLLAQFGALGEATGLYRRLRYFDPSGRERARLDLAEGQGGGADHGSLADLFGDQGIRQAIPRAPGEVTISRLVLDRESARAPASQQAVVRYAVAVFSGTRFAGVIVLDAAPRPLLTSPLLPGSTMFIADPEGWYCGHTDPERAWSGPQNRRTGHNARRDYGAAADLMLQPVSSAQDLDTRVVATSPVRLGDPAAGDYMVVGIDVPHRVALAGVGTFRRFFWIVLAIGFVAPVAAGLALGAFFLHPLRRLERGMHSVASGDLETRVHIRSGDEIEHLADDFNVMLSRLRELRQQERVAVVGHLAGNISHDIKNMLTPLQGCAETLAVLFVEMFSRLDAVLADPDVPQQTKEQVAAAVADLRGFYPDAVEMVLQGSLGIQDQVREIADYVKGVTADPVLEPTDVCEVAERVLKPLVFVGDRRGVSVTLDCPADLSAVPADQRLLFSAIYNLVNNAISATPEEGSVAIRVSAKPEGAFPEGAHLEIEVADTGRGMPEAIRASLFTVNARSSKADGTGLGTRIVKNAVDAHGGTITVESEEGRGSTFTIRLPLRATRGPAPSAALAEPPHVPSSRMPV